eukprot:1997101-Prymnesium_polylepis.3
MAMPLAELESVIAEAESDGRTLFDLCDRLTRLMQRARACNNLLNKLPNELLGHILDLLGVKPLAQLSCVCRAFDVHVPKALLRRATMWSLGDELTARAVYLEELERQMRGLPSTPNSFVQANAAVTPSFADYSWLLTIEDTSPGGDVLFD